MTTLPLPRPWGQLPASAARDVIGVFTDIDDTITTAGALTADARSALEQLWAAGMPVIAVTGRPLGWSAAFMQPGPDAWPVAAIVAENGAVAVFQEAGALVTEFAQAADVRERNVLRLQHAAERVLCEVPGSTLARDIAGRATDIAVDHAEHAHLSASQVDAVVAVMRAEGMNATVSSIHINGWFGAHTKLTGAEWMLRRLYGRALHAEYQRWVYVGDSTNDQAMFGHFPLSVGVANLADFAAQLTVWPSYLTLGARGAGFAEVARTLLAARAPR